LPAAFTRVLPSSGQITFHPEIEMSQSQQPGYPPGYLTEVEASHLLTQAIPGAIVVHLKREIEIDGGAGRTARRMFIELSLGEAVQHWQHMGDLIKRAGAMQRASANADASGNL